MQRERDEAVFLNGVYESVLEEIRVIQSVLPDLILFLQPYKAQRIIKLADNPPTCEEPIRLYVSTTDELASVSYTAEIVGWDDKRSLTRDRFVAISRVVWSLQPTEGGLYDSSTVEGEESVNLLHVRRLELLDKPFSVSRLIKRDGTPYSENRATAGGWSYVTLSR